MKTKIQCNAQAEGILNLHGVFFKLFMMVLFRLVFMKGQGDVVASDIRSFNTILNEAILVRQCVE